MARKVCRGKTCAEEWWRWRAWKRGPGNVKIEKTAWCWRTHKSIKLENYLHDKHKIARSPSGRTNTQNILNNHLEDKRSHHQYDATTLRTDKHITWQSKRPAFFHHLPPVSTTTLATTHTNHTRRPNHTHRDGKVGQTQARACDGSSSPHPHP